MPIAQTYNLRAVLAYEVTCPNPKCGHITTTSHIKKYGFINCSRCHIAIKIPDFNTIAAHSASSLLTSNKKAERE